MSVIGDYVDLIRGTTYKSALLGQPGPVLLGLATIQRNGGFRRDSLRTYGGESPEKLLVQPGELYVSLKDVTQAADLLGAVARVPVSVGVGRLTQDTVKLVARKRMLLSEQFSGYLYWLLRTPEYRDYCRARATGTTNLGLSRDDFLSFPVPPLNESRQQIVNQLERLEAKIELNERMNATLDEMARALFKSWFVDFDPVRAKAEGRQPSHMDAATAALFPASFEDSPLGPIPAGWRVSTVGAEFEVTRGLSYKGKYLTESGLPLHNLNSVYEGGGYKYPGLKFYSGEYQDRHIVRAGDLVVANTEQGHDRLLIGYGALVPSTFGDFGLFSHHLYRLRSLPSSSLSNIFLYLLLRRPRVHGLVSGFANGTTVNMLPVDALTSLAVPIPPVEVIRAFTDRATPLLSLAEMHHSENVTLAELRDALLPKLISGELRVEASACTAGSAC